MPFLVAALVLIAGLASGGYYLRSKDARGAVFVDSDPPGARVLIADRWVNATPQTIERVPVGLQHASIMLPGYERVEVEVDVKADTVVNIPKVALRHSTGRLTISSKPPNATFELLQDDVVARRGTLPVDIPDMPTGP